LEQVLLNLPINARDAIPDRGSHPVRAESREFTPEEIETLPWAMTPGRYSVLSVEDTGTGIPADLMDRIFEPFFTTKPPGQGTGLGLSMVYGMMKQSRGFVMVDSEVGKGSAFRLVFPSVAPGTKSESSGPLESVGRAPAGGRVLLVEDDPGVGGIIKRILERAGYEVLHVGNGREALERIEREPNRVDLILSDVAMPEMSGSELVQVLKQKGYSHPVILISGFAEEELSREARYDAAAFLRKPFTPEELSRVVREVLRK
jgi:two-component system cell cycle sensor histidine kinase/response regulator CckA